MSVKPHVHKCVVYECPALIECSGNCVEGQVPDRPICDEHLPMWLAIDKALDEAGYTEDGRYWYLNGIRQGNIPNIG